MGYVAPASPLRQTDELSRLERAAEELRDIADQLPAAADELRQMASELEAEARRKFDVVRDAIHPENMVLPARHTGKRIGVSVVGGYSEPLCSSPSPSNRACSCASRANLAFTAWVVIVAANSRNRASSRRWKAW